MSEVVLGFCVLNLFGILLPQKEVVGKVTQVFDGNTIEVISPDKQKQKLLLADVDSPELGQEYGDRAKKFLEKKILGKEVKITVKGKDRTGVCLAIISFNGEDLRIAMLNAGLAWAMEKNSSPELDQYCKQAKEKGVGLWKQDNPVPPWVYRREQSMVEPKSSN